MTNQTQMEKRLSKWEPMDEHYDPTTTAISAVCAGPASSILNRETISGEPRVRCALSLKRLMGH